MNKGLYDGAGASATDRAAAWVNRFEAPMTNWSKVYSGFRPPEAQRRGAPSSRGALGARQPPRAIWSNVSRGLRPAEAQRREGSSSSVGLGARSRSGSGDVAGGVYET